jgi:acyl phosphate:glycerol-3-phosphate acyltransferase
MQFVHDAQQALFYGPIALIASFLSGSIPFSLLVGLAKGTDIRKVGSGNVGATNLGRALGPKYFFVGFGLDMLKGLLPVLLTAASFGTLGSWSPPLWATSWLLGCIVACVLGHIYSPWIGLKGGKGVATTFGAVLGLFPLYTWTALVGLVVFLIALAIWRYISASSILAGIAMSFATVVLSLRGGGWRPESLTQPSALLLMGVMTAIASLVIYKHRTNIARLRAGTEPKVGQRAKLARPQ